MGKTNYRHKSNGQLDGSFRTAVSPPKFSEGGAVAPLPVDSAPPGEDLPVYDVYQRLLPPPPHMPQERIPAELLPALENLRGELDSIQIEDSSKLKDTLPTGNGWIPLSDLTDPLRARNNCYAAAVATTVYLRQELPDTWTAENINLWYAVSNDTKKGAAHWATMLTNNRTGEELIVDLTASQFRTGTPQPLVSMHSAWRTWVSSIVRNKHGAEFQWERVGD